MDRGLHLTDGSVLVRPYQPGDVESLHEAVRESIAELSVWMPWCHSQYSIEESRAWVESRADAWAQEDEYSFTITDAKDGLFLGGCGLNQINRPLQSGNLGYWVRSSRTGQGVATAAALLIARFGFEELDLERIAIAAALENSASQRVAEKIGATRELVLRDRLIIHDRAYDAVVFSLVPEDLITKEGRAPT